MRRSGTARGPGWTCVGISLDVVVALELVDPGEYRVVRAPRAADEVQQRQCDRDADPPKHAEHGNARERDHRQRELRAAPAIQAAGRPDVDETGNRDDHDGRKCRLREVVHEAGPDDQQQRQQAGADEPGDLTACTNVLGDSRARAAGREGNPWKNPVAMFATPSTPSSWF